MVDPRRHRLGETVSARRRRLGLSIPAAAKRARLDRETWRNLEAGTREIRSYNHAPVEQVLQWQPGSIEAILAGGEPKPLLDSSQAASVPEPPNAYVDPVTEEEYEDPDERELWGLIALAERDRRELIYHLRARKAARQAEEHRDHRRRGEAA